MNTTHNNDEVRDREYQTPFGVDLWNPSFRRNFQAFFRRASSLPAPIKNILADPSTAEYIEEKLGPEFGLDSEQKTEITRIVRDILLADIFIGDFPAIVTQRLSVNQSIANQIAQKIVSELFTPAIEEIKKMQKEKFGNRIARDRNAPSAQPRRPAGFVRPDETVHQGNVVNLRDSQNQENQ